MNDVEILRSARELISQPEAWTKGCLARNAKREPVWYASADAVCWCATGATGAVAAGSGYGYSADEYLMRAVREKSPCTHVENYNDQQEVTHSDILEVFDLAIKLAEQRLGRTTERDTLHGAW